MEAYYTVHNQPSPLPSRLYITNLVQPDDTTVVYTACDMIMANSTTVACVMSAAVQSALQLGHSLSATRIKVHEHFHDPTIHHTYFLFLPPCVTIPQEYQTLPEALIAASLRTYVVLRKVTIRTLA